MPLFACIFLAYVGLDGYFDYRAIDKSELHRIEGTVKELQYSKQVKSSEVLVLYLNEYPSVFYISSIDASAFKRKAFKANVSIGSMISMNILDDDYDRLISNTPVWIALQGISVNEKDYLNIQDLNKARKSDANAALYISSFSIVTFIATLWLYIKHKLFIEIINSK
jgi:hypothetical protein